MGKYLDMAKAWKAQQANRTEPTRTVMPAPFSSDAREKESARPLYSELEDATPSSTFLEVFPDWQALLVKSSVLGMSVWVVRDHLHGLALAKETGHPALLLDDVIRLKGQSQEDARAALLPVLITLEQ